MFSQFSHFIPIRRLLIQMLLIHHCLAACGSDANSVFRQWQNRSEDLPGLTIINAPSGSLFIPSVMMGWGRLFAHWHVRLCRHYLWPFRFFLTDHIWSSDGFDMTRGHPSLSGGDAGSMCVMVLAVNCGTRAKFPSFWHHPKFTQWSVHASASVEHWGECRILHYK